MTGGDEGSNEGSKAELLRQLVNQDSDAETAQYQAVATGLRPWHWLLVALLSALVGGMLVAFFLPAQSRPTPPPAVNSSPEAAMPAAGSSVEKALPASPQPVISAAILNASGYVTARRVATVSAETMGLITEVGVEEGMHVKEGQVLARLDDRKADVNLQLTQAQTQTQVQRLKSVVTDLEEAERVLARLSQLEQENFSSEAQRTRAETDVAKLRASLASGQAELEVARLNVARAQETLDDHTIRAPFSGVITAKNAQPGEIVAPAAAGGGFTRTGICTLVDMESLEIQVDVNEAYIGRVVPGQKVIANLDAYPKWDIPASVIAVIPSANRAKATVQVRIKISQLDSRILPNMGVKVAFFDE